MVKIAFGSIGDSFSASSIKAYVAEFIATLLFVFAGVGSAIFAGVGSAIAYNKLTYNAALDPPGLVAVAVAHAFALFVGVSMAANIRGGHLNPAVTFGLAIGGNITILTGFFYWIAQCLGSTVACFLLQFVTNGMLVFPIIRKCHFFISYVDFRYSRIEIIDNSTMPKTNIESYGDVPEDLKDLLHDFLIQVGEKSKAAVTLNLVPRRMQMHWRDAKNHVDCDVHMMRHMDTYAGQGVHAWDCGIVVAEMNIHRLRNIFSVVQYVSTPLPTVND